MLVNLEPVRMNSCALSRRERKWISFVDGDRFRHLVVPRADVCAHEVEDALQRGYQNPRNVVGRVDAQLPSSSASASIHRTLGNRDVPICQKFFWRNSSLHQPRVWITAHDDIRYAVAILSLIVLVLQDPPRRHCDTRWWRPFVANKNKALSTMYDTNEHSLTYTSPFSPPLQR